MRVRQFLGIGIALLPGVAVAQPASGLYVNIGGGANFAGDLLSANRTTKVYTDAGALGLVDVGWNWGNGVRTAIEGSYRSNSITGLSTRRVNGDLLPLANSDGTARTYAVMANVIYDLPFHVASFPIRPYVGAGAGYGWLDLGSASGNGYGRITTANSTTYNGATYVNFGSGGAFAYQAIVGASMPLHILPRLALTAEYRFFGTARIDVPVQRTSVYTTDLVNGVLPSASTHPCSLIRTLA